MIVVVTKSFLKSNIFLQSCYNYHYRSLYRAIFEHNHGYLLQSTKGSVPKLMNIQMELRKCCNHPFLIRCLDIDYY